MPINVANLSSKFKKKLEEESARSAKSLGPDVPTVFIPEGTHKLRFLADKDENIVESKFVHRLPIVRVRKDDKGNESKYLGSAWRLCLKFDCPLCQITKDPKYKSVIGYSDGSARLTKVLIQVLETDSPDKERGWVPGGILIGMIKGKKFYESLVQHYNVLCDNGEEFAGTYFDPESEHKGCSVVTVTRGAQGSVTMNYAFKPIAPAIKLPDWYSKVTLKQPLVDFDAEYTDEMYTQFIKETKEGYDMMLEAKKSTQQTSSASETQNIVNEVLTKTNDNSEPAPTEIKKPEPVVENKSEPKVDLALNAVPTKVVEPEVLTENQPDCLGQVDLGNDKCKVCTKLVACIEKKGGI